MPYAGTSVYCNYQTNVHGNCYDEFNSAAKNVFRQDNDGDRARTLGEALRNCLTCATESTQDAVNRLTDPQSNGD
jgi:hypothetical protein